MMTVWKSCPECPHYLISDDGRVRHVLSKRERKLQKAKNGYLVIDFRLNGKNVLRTVHSLVAETFIGPRPTGSEVRHLDGNKENNCDWNLCYGTQIENASDRDSHGRTARGLKNGNGRLSESEVQAIRELYQDQIFNQRELAGRFSISQAQVSNIILNKQRKLQPHIDSVAAELPADAPVIEWVRRMKARIAP